MGLELQNGNPNKLRKEWTKMKGENAWTMFKVIAEFVDGFEKLNSIGPCVSIFGSARTKPDHPNYKKAVEIASRFTHEGYGVITRSTDSSRAALASAQSAYLSQE